MAGGLTLEQAQAAGFAPPASRGMTADEAMAAGFQPAASEDPAAKMLAAKHEVLGGPAPPEPSVGERIMTSFKNTGHALGAAGEQLLHPVDLVTDPAKLSSFVRGLDDAVTFGAGQRLADKAHELLGWEGIAPTSEQERQERGGGARVLGNISGTFLPGASSAIVKGAGRAVGATRLGRLAPAGAIPGAALGTARAVAGYEASAPIIAGGQAAVRGENPIEAAYHAATDPAGLALAGAAGAVHGAGRGGAAKIRDPKTQTGRDLGDIEAVGGKVRPLGAPARGGAFETPEMAAEPLDRAGNVKFAEKSAGRAVEHAQKRYEDAQEAWGTKAEQILADHHPDEIYKADSTHGALKAIDGENTVNGVTGDEKIAKATAKVRQMLTSETGEIDTVASANADKIVYRTEPGGTVSDFMKVRKLVNNMARHTTEPAEKYVFGKVLGAMAADAATIDPRIGELNAEYRKAMESLSASNDAMFGQKKSRIKDTEGARAQAAGRMSRVGDPTQFGPLADARLERFGAESPENAREVAMMRARKAATRLRYGEPETSTSFEKGITRGAEHGAKKVAGAVLGHAVGGPVGGAIGYGIGHVLQSLPQAKVRIGLPVMESIGRGSGVGPGVAAQQAEQQRAIELIMQARELEASLAARRSRALQGGR
jgi:hypothetical protein